MSGARAGCVRGRKAGEQDRAGQLGADCKGLVGSTEELPCKARGHEAGGGPVRPALQEGQTVSTEVRKQETGFQATANPVLISSKFL